MIRSYVLEGHFYGNPPDIVNLRWICGFGLNLIVLNLFESPTNNQSLHLMSHLSMVALDAGYREHFSVFQASFHFRMHRSPLYAGDRFVHVRHGFICTSVVLNRAETTVSWRLRFRTEDSVSALLYWVLSCCGAGLQQ